MNPAILNALFQVAAICDPCVKQHLLKECKGDTGIIRILYACPEDFAYTCVPDCNNLNPQAIVDTLTALNTGENPNALFHEIFTTNQGDNATALAKDWTLNDDGTEDRTLALTAKVRANTPENAAILEALEGNPHLFIIQCKGTDYPFMFIDALELRQRSFNTSNKDEAITFDDPSNCAVCKKIWNTDFATTLAMIDANVAA